MRYNGVDCEHFECKKSYKDEIEGIPIPEEAGQHITTSTESSANPTGNSGTPTSQPTKATDSSANDGKKHVRYRMPKPSTPSINPKAEEGGAPEPLDDLADSTEAKKQAIRELQPIEKIRLYLDENYIFRRNTLKNIVEYLPMASDTKRWEPFEDKQFYDLVIQLEILGFRAPEKRVEKLLGSSMIADYNAIKDYFELVGKMPAAGGDVPAEFLRLCECVRLSPLDIQIGAYAYRDLFEYYFFKWLQACCDLPQSGELDKNTWRFLAHEYRSMVGDGTGTFPVRQHTPTPRE